MATAHAISERNHRLAELLSKVALGDQRAFGDFYRQTSAHLYAVAVRILRDAQAAEEILQEAYVNVWHHAGSYVAANWARTGDPARALRARAAPSLDERLKAGRTPT